MKVCQKCNLEYEDKFAFCKKCGGKLEVKVERIVCPNCGNEAETVGGFCPFCGTSLTEKTSDNVLKADVQQHKPVHSTVVSQTDKINGKNNKGIIIAGIAVLIAIVGFLVFGGNSLFNKKLPEAENDGTIALAAAMDKGKWGLLDKKGNWFIEPSFIAIGQFSEGLVGALDSDSKKYGFIDKNGKWIIKPQYYVSPKELEEAGKVPPYLKSFSDYQARNIGAPVFKEGFARVQFAEKNYGFIDKKGNVLCSNYEDAYPFKNGYAEVKIKKGKKLSDNICAIIDTKGQFAIKPVKGLIVAHCEDEGCFLIRTGGVSVFKSPYSDVSHEYDSAHRFSEGLAFVIKDGQGLIIDKNYNVVINLMTIEEILDCVRNNLVVSGTCVFEDGKLAIDFSNGKDILSETVKTITIDKKGNVVPNVVKDEYANIGKDELVPKSESFGNYGYVNNKGEYVIKPQFGFADKFKDGVAVVQGKGDFGETFGLIDMKGNFIKELSKDVILETECGLIIAGKDGKIGALDSTGKKTVIPYKFEAIHSYKKYKKEDLLGNNVE